MAQRDPATGSGVPVPKQAAPRDPAAPHARLALARRRAAERDRTRGEFESALARSRLILRVERALRQILEPREVLSAAAMVDHGGGGRRGWALSGLALYVGDFARLEVSRVPLERITSVAIGVDGPPYRVTVDIAGEPPRRVEDGFGPTGLEVAQRLLRHVSDRP